MILEGLAAGCSVVASAVGGAPSLVGEFGRLLPPSDAAALGTALEAAVRDDEPTRERAMQAAARFDWSVVGPKLVGATLTVPLTVPRAR